MKKRKGVSYQKRVEDINRIYDEWSKTGLPNREIWRRYVYPVYGISERTFYNILKVSLDPTKHIPGELQLFFDFEDYDSHGEPEFKSHYPQNPEGHPGGAGR